VKEEAKGSPHFGGFLRTRGLEAERMRGNKLVKTTRLLVDDGFYEGKGYKAGGVSKAPTPPWILTDLHEVGEVPFWG